jgi:hypothetical protein
MTTLADSERAQGAPPHGDEGRVIPMTVFSRLKPALSWPPGGATMQRVVFAIGRRGSYAPIRALGLIHFARFSLVDGLPGQGEDPERLRYPLQLFESNYDVTFDHYIDAFVDRIPWQMRELWGWSYGFPWRLRPTSRFKTYIHRNEFDIDHYYVAFPEATVAMIEAALDLIEPHKEFHRRTRDLGPEEFIVAYREFLAEVQEQL